MKIRSSTLREILLFSLASCGFLLGLYMFNLTANTNELSKLFLILFFLIYILFLTFIVIITMSVIKVIGRGDKYAKLDYNLTMDNYILLQIFTFTTNIIITVLHFNDLFWSEAVTFNLFQFIIAILVIVIKVINKKHLYKMIKLN